MMSFIGLFLLVINIIFFNHIALGTAGLMLFLTGLGLHIGSLLTLNSRLEKKFWGIVLTLIILTLLNSIVYYSYGITKPTSIIVLILPLVLFLLKQKKHNQCSNATVSNIHPPAGGPISKYYKTVISLPILLDISLLTILFLSRTTDVAPSPWWTLSPWFFILYAFTTGFVLYSMTKQKKTGVIILLASLHFFVTYSVASIIYTLGFGFDGFIHRATEVWIQTYGFILPKQPFYIGQYSLVVWLSNVTSIPIFYIDVYLVPILASLSIPATVIFTIKKICQVPYEKSTLLVWLIPFVPSFSLYLTTPHNLLILLSILIVFTTIGFSVNKLPFIVPLMLALAGITTHPLLGCPMLLFVLTSLIIKKVKSKKINISLLVLFTLTTIFIFPLMFTVYLLLSRSPLPELLNPFTQFDKFLELFTRPYWYAKQSPFVFELLYIWQRLIAPIVICLAILGFIKKEKQTSDYLFPLGFVGFVLGAWLLRSWIVFPNVVSYEQSNYPLRLLYTSLIFLLPLAMCGASVIFSKITFVLIRLNLFQSAVKLSKTNSRLIELKQIKTDKILKIIAISIISIFLMFSFYLSYPQHNPKARFPGYNITAADFEAAQWIHNDNDQYNYIVLSNMLTSAAALTEYSFAKHFDTAEGELFYYAIPTGGPLYKYYGKMLYEGQKREYMLEAMDLMGVDKSYFVVNSYWANFKNIVEGAKKTANSWQEIDNGKIMIFEYSR